MNKTRVSEDKILMSSVMQKFYLRASVEILAFG
jgi:hypothetical protein